jgi:RNA polymerase sigma-70 factor (ECF subfamily)
MAPSRPPLAAAALQAHGRFLRPIVRALLAGEHDVEDIVQETQVRAWQRTRTDSAPGTAWLSRVARNSSFDRLRARRQLQRLHSRLPAATDATSPSEVMHAEEHRQCVVKAVLALPRPCRDVVPLRFWEEQSPTAICKRLGVPAATVRSQLKRGMAMLRAQLDIGCGERRQWVTALVPIAFARPREPLCAWGLFLMTKAKLVAMAASVVIAGLVVWWLSATPHRGAPQSESRRRPPRSPSGQRRSKPQPKAPSPTRRRWFRRRASSPKRRAN